MGGSEYRSKSDSELVAGYLRGNQRCFTELDERYRERLTHFITRKTGDPDCAEDLVQELFARVTKHLYRYDRSKPFNNWVFTIAANLAKCELRNRTTGMSARLQKPGQYSGLDYLPTANSNNPELIYDGTNLQRVVDETLNGLPPRHRESYRLREEGYSYAEIGEITGVQPPTARLHRYFARRALKQRLAEL